MLTLVIVNFVIVDVREIVGILRHLERTRSEDGYRRVRSLTSSQYVDPVATPP